MVEDVEEVSFKLESNSLRNFEGLAEPQIRVEESRANQRVALHFTGVAPQAAIRRAWYSGFGEGCRAI